MAALVKPMLDAADLNPESRRDAVVTAVLQDVSHWKLEPGKSRQVIHVPYIFGVDSSMPHGHADVEYAPPNRWKIQVNQPHGPRLLYFRAKNTFQEQDIYNGYIVGRMHGLIRPIVPSSEPALRTSRHR